MTTEFWCSTRTSANSFFYVAGKISWRKFNNFISSWTDNCNLSNKRHKISQTSCQSTVILSSYDKNQIKRLYLCYFFFCFWFVHKKWDFVETPELWKLSVNLFDLILLLWCFQGSLLFINIKKFLGWGINCMVKQKKMTGTCVIQRWEMH